MAGLPEEDDANRRRLVAPIFGENAPPGAKKLSPRGIPASPEDAAELYGERQKPVQSPTSTPKSNQPKGGPSSDIVKELERQAEEKKKNKTPPAEMQRRQRRGLPS